MSDPKKTQLGWVPHYPEHDTQPFQQQPQPEYLPQGYAQQPPYGQQAYPQQYHQQYPPSGYEQHHYYQQPPPPPPPVRGSNHGYPPAAAYNYSNDAAAVVQNMQHAEAEKQLEKAASKRASNTGKRPIANADATKGMSDRARFIRLTYLHLLLAILAFAGLLYCLMTVPFLQAKVSAPLIKFALGGRWNWGVVLGVFMVVSWVADYWASHATSRVTQYAGLAFYVVAEALIFVPLLAIVAWKTQAIVAKGGGDPNIIRDSAYVTLGVFAALTASVFITKKDFSFLRSGLFMASGAALTLIVLSLSFGFNLGLAFSVGMVLLAAAYILYQTSQVLAHYDPNQHVAASLALFSSVALMFWYVIRIFLKMRAE